MDKKKIYSKAIARYGQAQLQMIIEEMAELTQAISKYSREKPNNIEDIKQQKLERLESEE